MIEDLNVRPETVKLLEENIGWNLHDISFGSDLRYDPKSTASKSKNRQMGLHQSKELLHSKGDKGDRVKRKPREWDKIFANHTSDKGLMSKRYKELLQLDSKKPITQFKKGAE